VETQKKELMQDISKEKWIVKINTGNEYVLGGNQAKLLQDAIATGNRGIIMFQTFSISIPYIAEFYRESSSENNYLPKTATEEPYKPTPEQKEKMEIAKTKLRKKMGWNK